MENIIFKNLHHISELENVIKKVKKSENIKTPGIYIWGYVVDKQISKILEFNEPNFDTNSMKFIPYYVGLDSNLFDRISSHRKFENGDATKYTRMSEEYMLRFFKDCNYPVKTDDKDIHDKYLKINIVKDKNEKNSETNKFVEPKNVLYYNNSIFLKKTYTDCKVNEVKKTENPITKFNEDNGYIIEDTLREIYNYTNQTKHKNNLWFSYALINDCQDFIKCRLEDFEALTFYSLKGKTISKTKKIDDISKNIQICFEGKELENIFKCNNININILEEKYLDENKEVKFNGY